MRPKNIPSKDEFIIKAELNGIDFSKNVYDLTIVERNTMDVLAKEGGRLSTAKAPRSLLFFTLLKKHKDKKN
jgi:hypothetical protein